MESGIYIVTLNNSEPISVNAQDPRIAHKAIKVTKANCKFGKAKNLKGREKNYFKTFGEHNVNFIPVALVEDFAQAEKTVLARLDQYRIRGRTGRKNEWLEGIKSEDVLRIVLDALELLDIPHKLFDSHKRIPVDFKSGNKTVAFCPFCHLDEDRIFLNSELVKGIWDDYPLNPGHVLLIPHRHIARWFDATREEQVALTSAIEHAKVAIEEKYSPQGFNVGFNDQKTAGQTIPHLHIHMIPRYEGDVSDPRGGIRNIIPARAAYWKSPA